MIRGVSSEGAHVKPSNIRIRAAKPIDFPKVAAMHYPVWRQSWTGILDPYLLDMIGSPKLWVEESYPQSLKRGGGLAQCGRGGALVGRVRLSRCLQIRRGRAWA